MGGLTFKPDLAEAVMAGRKTETRRRKSDNPRSPWWREECGFRGRPKVAVQPGRGKKGIGHIKILSTGWQRLGRLSELEARAEGFADVEAFKAKWIEINKTFDLDEIVWVLRFEVWRRYMVVADKGRRRQSTHELADLPAVVEEIADLNDPQSFSIFDQETNERISLDQVLEVIA